MSEIEQVKASLLAADAAWERAAGALSEAIDANAEAQSLALGAIAGSNRQELQDIAGLAGSAVEQIEQGRHTVLLIRDQLSQVIPTL